MSIFNFEQNRKEGNDKIVEKRESQQIVPLQQQMNSAWANDRLTSVSTENTRATYQRNKGSVARDNRRAGYTEKSKVKWPQYGASPAMLFNSSEIKIMVEGELMCTKGFIAFIREWRAYNTTSANKRSVFVPGFEYNLIPDDIQKVFHPMLIEKENVSIYYDVKNYEELFAQQNVQGPYLFLSKSLDKAKKVKSIAYKVHKELRFFTLDDGGKLSGFTDNGMVAKQSVVSGDEQFKIMTAITQYNRANKLAHGNIGKGGMVYDDQGNEIILLQEFMSNAMSITYRTNQTDTFAKIYAPNVLTTTYFEDKTELMLQKPIRRRGIGWPISKLYDVNGCFVGALIPQAEGIPLMQSVLGEEQLKLHFPDWNKKDLCDLTICILEHIIFLQDRHIFFGCINPQSIFVKDKNHVYFVDMDCYQIEGYPCVSQNITFQPPELQLSGIRKRLYTQQTENYEVAELVFMLMMPGKTPYAKEKNADMAQSIANMRFPFSWIGQPGKRDVDRPSGRWRFVWSHLGSLKGDFYNTFMSGKEFNAPEKRKSARFWLHEVRSLRKDLEHPYDMESLELFPKTFKRDAKTQFFKCQYCGVEYPKFYFYRKYFDTPYRICNSCLNTPSDKYFECISSYHTSVDRKFIYSKKMAIFHQIATVQNSDWHKQRYCSECKHIRSQVYKKLRCRNCGCSFDFTFGQKEDYDKRFGIDNWGVPNNCPECKRKQP